VQNSRRGCGSHPFLLMTLEKAINNQMLFCQRTPYLSFIIESSLECLLRQQDYCECILLIYRARISLLALCVLILRRVLTDFNQQFVQIISSFIMLL